MVILLACVLLFAAAVVYFLYSYTYKPFLVLKRIGVKGPEPSVFFGNSKEIKQLGILKFIDKYSKKFGSVWGYYLGIRPLIVVSDVDLLKRVFVKDFESFINRMELPTVLVNRRGLLLMKGEEWREARHILSPTFSAMKMKQMVPLLQKSCDTLVKKMGEAVASKEPVDVWRLFGSFTMESILATAFGRVLNIQEGEGDQLTKAAAHIFGAMQEGNTVNRNNLVPLLDHFPFLLPVFRQLLLRSARARSAKVLEGVAMEIVKERRREGTRECKFKDLLQLMMDASDESTGKKLTDEQILGNSRTFLLAGYETTSNALAYTAYLLALNPDIQERLCHEIDHLFEEEAELSMYDVSQQFEYLDQVVQESLRLYPPAFRTHRECLKATVVQGMTIPKGTVIEIPIIHIHRNPQYWDDPMKFDPERFTSEEKAKRDPLCHIPFGWGPRNCIGLRFALMEAKMALIGILKKYKFERAPETEVPLQIVPGITIAPKNGVDLKIVDRFNAC